MLSGAEVDHIREKETEDRGTELVHIVFTKQTGLPAESYWTFFLS